MVMCLLILLAGCGTNDHLNKISELEAVIEQSRNLPDYPEDCRKTERTGITSGDRLDTANIKADQAVGRGNKRVIRCAGWYDDLKSARANQGGDQHP